MLSLLHRKLYTGFYIGRRTLASVAPGSSSSLLYNGTTYPFRWLRDSCQCPECIHPSTRQKLHRSSDITANIHPAPDGIQVREDGVEIQWDTGHRSFYPSEILHNHGSPQNLRKFHKDVDPVTWNAERIRDSKTLFVPYEEMQEKPGKLKALEQLAKYGLLLVTNVPTSETSHESCEVRTLAQMFGEIRTTFYGELWDVKNIRNSTNIAYTNLDLGYHIDLQYFNHPPRYQFLHCLRNRVQGGVSLFVDAIYAAQELREKYPEDFNLLTTIPVTFHYINDGHHLHNAHPTIELAAVSGNPAELRPIRHINYSPPFQAPLPLSTPSEFYSALKRFASLLDRPTSRFEYLLREGDAVIFDNRRVLHARTAFTDNDGEGQMEVNRWLKGCYVEADSVFDRLRVLRSSFGKDV
ncbi:hypothetical protein QCA50_004434 [Cerrena zonata]|uniref:Clavaminate synthase-like protein n=1 Tax=Cerrena zonata TaxID=2478898 RepID=A0AAW0GTW8_9APHY